MVGSVEERMVEKKWGVSGLYQLAGIWRDIYMNVFISLYFLVYEFHLYSWHMYMVQVSGFKGYV